MSTCCSCKWICDYQKRKKYVICLNASTTKLDYILDGHNGDLNNSGIFNGIEFTCKKNLRCFLSVLVSSTYLVKLMVSVISKKERIFSQGLKIYFYNHIRKRIFWWIGFSFKRCMRRLKQELSFVEKNHSQHIMIHYIQ